MNKKIYKIIDTIMFYGLFVSVWIFALWGFLNQGESLVYSIFSSIGITILFSIMVVCLYALCWQLFTEEGREQQRELAARNYIKKLDRKREREWRRMYGDN